MADVELVFLDEEETWKRFDDASRSLLGISGSDFAKRLDEGDIEDLPNSAVMRVAILRPAAA